MSKERLTKRNESNTAYYFPLCFEKCDGIGASRKCDRCELVDNACNKLGEYEELEEQGLLLRLPCKVGDTVWEIVDECEGDSAGCYGTCDACHNRRLSIEETKFTIDMIDDVGNWFFLTQAEAEEKLRELEWK